jgi:hypothetical protein
MVYTNPGRWNFTGHPAVLLIKNDKIGVWMSKRTRFFLLLIALVLIGVAVTALAYAVPEIGSRQLQATVAPTLFTPPPP